MSNYLAKITAHSLAESRQEHKPFVKLLLATERDLDNNEEIHKNLYASLWLTEKAVERTLRTLRAIGFQGDTLNDINTTECLVGAMCEISTEWVEFRGEQREEVTFVNEEGNRARRGFKPLDEDASKRVCNRYNAMLRGIAKGHPPKKAKTPDNVAKAASKLGAEVTEENPEENLPF